MTLPRSISKAADSVWCGLWTLAEDLANETRGIVKHKNSLVEKVAIVTGASSGIGRATAMALAREGADVVLAARDLGRMQAVAQEIQQIGGKVLVVPTDVRKRDQVEHLVDSVVDTCGQVDVLIANAGIYVRRPVAELTVADLEHSMAVNFYGAVYCVLEVLPVMMRQGSGHLVLVNSMDGKKGIPPDAPYVAAKFALCGFGDVLRQELQDAGVFVTTVFPGRVDTPMIATLRVPRISAKISPDDVALAILRAIQHRSPEVIVPWYARALIYLHTLSPRLADRLVRLFRLRGWEDEAGYASE